MAARLLSAPLLQRFWGPCLISTLQFLQDHWNVEREQDNELARQWGSGNGTSPQLPAPQQLRLGGPKLCLPRWLPVLWEAIVSGLWLQTCFCCLIELSSFTSWGACFPFPCFSYLFKCDCFHFLGALAQACAVSDEAQTPLPSCVLLAAWRWLLLPCGASQRSSLGPWSFSYSAVLWQLHHLKMIYGHCKSRTSSW